MRCVIQMSFSFWISAESHFCQLTAKKMIQLIIGGGACAYNPEPLAEFFDLFYIGEGETVYDALFDAYKANKKAGGSRSDFLLKAAQIPGIYVPSLYEVTYKEDGTIESFHPDMRRCIGKSRKTADH